ncbi:MAG: substrate-binding domain-containing protein [Clostridia bacterium]|nr:substrate-binding domain-containing protein [Clostridia bacterium]
MKKIISLILVMACMLSFSSCAFIKSLFGIESEAETIDTAPSINVNEYLPFDENSKIVKYDSKTLKLTDNLPIIDGATAAFPVYSAFVNAVYPNTTKLYDDAFKYNNTVGGYRALAQRNTDIFIGAAPSEEQIEYAEEYGTTFEYTQIGWEAFVFFVHKDNPIASLTADEIRGIYSGAITNWNEVGGSDEEIVPFQRNAGSGSQSMMLRFMGDVQLVEPDTEQLIGFMGGIIEEVADYKNQTSSIGYSFRYYVEGIVCHPDIKMIAVNGVAPTAENIKNNTYPIIAPVYAVTYKNNPNPNVEALIDWMVSDEGQYIIKETGYVGIK